MSTPYGTIIKYNDGYFKVVGTDGDLNGCYRLNECDKGGNETGEVTCFCIEWVDRQEEGVNKFVPNPPVTPGSIEVIRARGRLHYLNSRIADLNKEAEAIKNLFGIG